MFRARLRVSRTARMLLAAFIAAVTLGISSVSLSSGVYSATLTISADGGVIATSSSQANLTGCATGVKSTTVGKPGKEKDVTTAEVTFESANTCAGATLSVAVVDKQGRVSQGTLTPLPIGAKDKVKVDLTGDAQRNDKPEFFINIA